MNLKELTNDQLVEKTKTLSDMILFRNDRLNEKRERHKKLNFDCSNPAFEQLKSEVEKELKDRGL